MVETILEMGGKPVEIVFESGVSSASIDAESTGRRVLTGGRTLYHGMAG